MNDYFRSGDSVIVRHHDFKTAESVEIAGEFIGFGIDPKDNEPFVAIKAKGVERRIGLDFFEGIVSENQVQEASVVAKPVAAIKSLFRKTEVQTETTIEPEPVDDGAAMSAMGPPR